MSHLNHIAALMIEISKKETKIQKLEKILNSKSIERIQIFFTADGKLNDIDQSDTPFSLTSELRLLIQESITQYEIDIQNLKLQF